MSLWTDLGFRGNPYNTTPIQPTEEGARLLVGRHQALKRLTRGITSADTIPTIEGDNGVGKTSLAAVATFSLRQDLREGRSSQVFLPLADSFQLLPDGDLEEFRRRLYYAVAHGFIKHGGTLKGARLSVPDYGDVRKWLDAPIARTKSGGASALSFGATASRSESFNTSDGFRDEGFRTTVDQWLGDCFPTREHGGFICLVDNLELLETSQAARSQLEALRDSLFNRPGLRWVLCGARGIVRSAASSARFERRLI